MKQILNRLKRINCMAWAMIAGASVLPMCAYGPGPTVPYGPHYGQDCSAYGVSITSLAASPSPLPLGQDLTVLVTLPLVSGASVSFVVSVTTPDGSTTATVAMPANDNGTNGDVQAGDGIFTYVWLANDSSYPFLTSGAYTIHVQTTLAAPNYLCDLSADTALTVP